MSKKLDYNMGREWLLGDSGLVLGGSGPSIRALILKRQSYVGGTSKACRVIIDNWCNLTSCLRTVRYLLDFNETLNFDWFLLHWGIVQSLEIDYKKFIFSHL